MPSLRNAPQANLSKQVYSYADMTYSAVEGLEPWDWDDSFRELLQEDVDKAAAPSKETLLHSLIQSTARVAIEQAAYDYPDDVLDEVLETLEVAGMPRPRWLARSHIASRRSGELCDLWTDAFDRAVAPAVFYILFSDHAFLIKFGRRVTEIVGGIKKSHRPDLVKQDGVLRRVHVPTWLGRAVFYRDRGCCQVCSKNLSGLAEPQVRHNLDHIIPLDKSGSNDPTNFQLLCESCNGTKRARAPRRLPAYTPYW